MRVRKIKNVEEKLKKYSNILLDKEELKKVTHDRIIAEFGMGKGDFINELSKRDDALYIGFDKYDEVLYRAAKKLKDKKNVNIVNLNLTMTSDYIPDHFFDELYLNFSDPWPKARHYKRRLTYRAFLEEYDRIIKPGGTLYFKTDSIILFEFTLNELFDTNRKAFDISLDVHNSSVYRDNIITEYERKFSTTNKIMALKYKVGDSIGKK